MPKIITLTVNPVLDKSTSVGGIVPNKKLRCAAPVYEPGGGGINVSRALKKLGEASLCLYLAGGPAGNHIKDLLEKEGIDQYPIPIKGWTRDNLSVIDTLSGQQYRFGVPGPYINAKEWELSLEEIAKRLAPNDFLVASGKLAPGLPLDYYVRLAHIAKEKNVHFVLDTSGDGLVEAVKAPIHLLKPNLGEMGLLLGLESIMADELESLAQGFIEKFPCNILVVSLGPKGALLVSREMTEHVPAPTVHQKSTIGAGDSMVAGMVYALFKGKTLSEMVNYGVACGSAATMTSGTELFYKKDADRLYKWIMDQKVKNPKKIPKLT